MRKGESKPMEFIKNYWYIVLGFIVGLPLLIRFYRKMSVKLQVDTVKNQMDLQGEINALDNPELQDNEADKILKNYNVGQRERLKADVKAFVHHLGVNYPWWNLRSWTENDKEAADILIKWVKHLSKFGELYYKVYTKSRNIKTDFNKLIDTSDKNRVYEAQNKYSIQYF